MKKQLVNDYKRIDFVPYEGEIIEPVSEGLTRGYHYRDATHDRSYMMRSYMSNVEFIEMADPEDDPLVEIVDLREFENTTRFVGFRFVRNR